MCRILGYANNTPTWSSFIYVCLTATPLCGARAFDTYKYHVFYISLINCIYFMNSGHATIHGLSTEIPIATHNYHTKHKHGWRYSKFCTKYNSLTSVSHKYNDKHNYLFMSSTFPTGFTSLSVTYTIETVSIVRLDLFAPAPAPPAMEHLCMV